MDIAMCFLLYSGVYVHAHALVVARVSSGSARISVGQTGAADGHAETCSVLHWDIFGLLRYCETGC